MKQKGNTSQVKYQTVKPYKINNNNNKNNSNKSKGKP